MFNVSIVTAHVKNNFLDNRHAPTDRGYLKWST